MKKLLVYIIFLTLAAIYPALGQESVQAPANAAQQEAPKELTEEQKLKQERLEAKEHMIKLRQTYSVSEDDDSVDSALKRSEFIQKSISRGLQSNIAILKKFGFNLKDLHYMAFGDITYISLVSAILMLVINLVLALAIIKGVYPITSFISKRCKWPLLEGFIKSTKNVAVSFFILTTLYTCFLGIFLDIGLVHYFQTLFSLLFLAWFLWVVVKLFDSLAAKVEKLGVRKSGFRELFPVIRKFLRLLLIVFLILYFLDECGFNVGNIVVSLGIGGAALAFASKDTIANFFGSISLIMDSPFRIGDRILVQGKLDGYVENIGLRSTRIRNLDRTLSILPNSYLANEYIVNISKWNTRKYAVDLGLTYSTTPEQLKNIVEEIEDMLRKDSSVSSASTIDASFAAFDDSSLRISVLCYINDVDYVPYMKAVQKINLKFMEIVERNGSSFAFPSRSIYMENTK